MTTPQPDVSVVVPVRDAEVGLERVVSELRSVEELSIEIVLVDDHSGDGSPDVIRRLEQHDDRTIAVFFDSNRGAGVARNEGFTLVTGRYTLFFDADDVLHPHALISAVRLLDQSGADLAFMPYRFRRGVVVDHEDMNEPDARIWSECMGDATQRHVRLADVPSLLGFTNYPWNKVLRTSTYREAGLRFGATPVHNDILGHWHALLGAERIVMLDEALCTHIVESGGRNLSNRQSDVRLALFPALDETYDLLGKWPELRNRYAHHYWAFVLRTASWAKDRVVPSQIGKFNILLSRHLLRINLLDFYGIRMARDPHLADEIVAKSLR